MCRGSLVTEHLSMLPTSEPFLSSEIGYRQQRVATTFKKHPRRRHHRLLRRRQKTVPEQRRGDGIVD